MTTIYSISEQVMRLLVGNTVISDRVKQAEVKRLVVQVANQLLKTDYLQMSLPAGDSVPNNCMVYTYENVPVVAYGSKSASILPAMPISLPKNLGVLHVSKMDAMDDPFIPIPTSLYGIVKTQDLLGELSGLIGYEVIGKRIVYTKNLLPLNISSVMVRLVGSDLSQLSDYEILPISADMEAQVIQMVYNLLVQLPTDERAQTVKA